MAIYYERLSVGINRGINLTYSLDYRSVGGACYRNWNFVVRRGIRYRMRYPSNFNKTNFKLNQIHSDLLRLLLPEISHHCFIR